MYARPFVRTQKRPHFALTGKMQASLTFDFFRLTLAAPAYSMCTAIHIERKSQAFMKYNLGFDNAGNPQNVCGAANLQRSVESIHSLQVDPHYQIPRRFIQINRAWIRIITASSSSFRIGIGGISLHTDSILTRTKRPQSEGYNTPIKKVRSCYSTIPVAKAPDPYKHNSVCNVVRTTDSR